ncbi:MAG: hypothetical protein KTR31_09050 [Myxococcales bacterium]|nr:hypothetical protein [Myxococcales bacterium]
MYGEGWDFGLEHKDARSMRIDLQRPSDSSTQARVKTILADVFGVRAQAIGLEAWSSSSTTLSSTFLVGPVLDLFREPNQGGWQFYWDYTKVELDLVRTNDLLAQAQHDQYKGSPEAANRFIRDSLDGVRPPTQLWQTTVQIRGSRRHEGFAEIPEMLAEAIRRLFDQTGYQVAEPANDAKGGAVHEREMRWVDAILDAIETGALDP